MTLYDVLGVTAGASADELRAAYWARARALHPDRHMDSPAEQQQAAAREMQELNAAWSVLSDPGRRRAYDQREVAAPTPTRSTVATRPVDEPDGDLGLLLARAMPLIVVLTILIGIFVFTAFAVRLGPDDDAPTAPVVKTARVGDCVSVSGGRVAGVVPCAGPSDGRVIQVIERTDACGTGETRADDPDGSHAVCLGPP